MFYVKTPGNSTVELDSDNVFSRCIACGREVPAGVSEIYQADGNQLVVSATCECYRSRTGFSDGINITLDGIAMLIDVLNKAGFGEFISDLFTRHGISDIKELHPEQYEPFAVALRKLATGEYGL